WWCRSLPGSTLGAAGRQSPFPTGQADESLECRARQEASRNNPSQDGQRGRDNADDGRQPHAPLDPPQANNNLVTLRAPNLVLLIPAHQHLIHSVADVPDVV